MRAQITPVPRDQHDDKLLMHTWGGGGLWKKIDVFTRQMTVANALRRMIVAYNRNNRHNLKFHLDMNYLPTAKFLSLVYKFPPRLYLELLPYL